MCENLVPSGWWKSDILPCFKNELYHILYWPKSNNLSIRPRIVTSPAQVIPATDSIEMVHFMCQVDWAKGCPGIYLNIIPGCVCEVPLDEISIWIGGLSRADSSPKIEQKVEEERICTMSSLPASQASKLVFCLWTDIYTIGFPGSQAVRLRLNHTTGFPGLQRADDRLWVQIISPHNHTHKSIPSNKSLISSVSLENLD